MLVRMDGWIHLARTHVYLRMFVCMYIYVSDICVWMHVCMQALLETKTLLAMVFDRFDFTPAPGHIVTHHNSVTLPMKYGFKVAVRRRGHK